MMGEHEREYAEQQKLPHTGDIVSIHAQNDPYPSVGRVIEVVGDDQALYSYQLLINPGTNYLPYWVHIDAQTRVAVLSIGETYRLHAGTHEGEQVRLSRLLQKAPSALVILGDGSEYYCPASVLEPRAETMAALQATYTSSDEVAWRYHLYLAGIYELKVMKRLTTGQEVVIQGAVQDASRLQTSLDFCVLPGDDNPEIEKEGETVQINVLQDEAVIASIIFRRKADDSLTVRTNGCDLTYLP